MLLPPPELVLLTTADPLPVTHVDVTLALVGLSPLLFPSSIDDDAENYK